MDKNELIEKAVIDLGGKLPNPSYRKTSNAAGWYISSAGKLTHAVDCVWVEPEEFEACAKRLGYINGYKWGVEYPTNGKRPDLPGDVIVQITLNSFYINNVRGYDANWSGSMRFKITDQRYKPAEPPPAKPWFEAGELPPISEQCEWKGLNGGFWVQCEVIDKYQDKEMVVFNTGEYRNCRYEILKLDSVEFRPIRTDREKFIDAAKLAFGRHELSSEEYILLDSLFERGFNIPETKTGD